MTHRWDKVAGAALGVLVAACTSNGKDEGPTGATGVVDLQATAFNAGSAAQLRRLVHPFGGAPAAALLPIGAAAPHTIDPATYRVHQFVSGPATELKITIKRIIAEGQNGEGSTLLFGTVDGSGPGVEITLTNGTVDLGAALELNPIPVGHYSRINIWPSRAVKMKGCVTGTFNDEPAVTGMYGGASYTSDALSAGTHQFCTIAAKSLLNYENGTAAPTGPIGTYAQFEAQTTPEEIEIDMGQGFPTNMAGTYASSAADVRTSVGNFDVFSEFDVDATHPVQLTLVVDMNRMLRFWPNIASSPTGFQPPQPQGYPAGTSYFYNDNINQGLVLFTGTPGSIEGYQLNSEICQDLGCVPGDPPDSLSREWMTLVRDSSGAIGGGLVAPDDAPAAIGGAVLPTLTTAGTAAGTLRLSLGDPFMTTEHGYLDGFVFKNIGDAEDSCSAYPVSGNGPVDGHGPFPLWYTRKL